MHIKIRRTFLVIEERREEAGRVSNLALRRVAAVAVVENPYAGRRNPLTPRQQRKRKRLIQRNKR